MSEANKAVLRRFAEIFNQGNLALLDEIFSVDSIYHGPNLPELRGREAIKEHFASLRRAFPDMLFTVHRLIAEADTVVTRWSLTGTHRGELWGIAPTGKTISISGTCTDRIADGMIAEVAQQWDALGFMQQLGAAPASTEANKALVRRYVEEILNQGNLALVDELCSADSLYHGPYFPELRGRESRKQFYASLRLAFPDIHFNVDELIAEGDKVAVRWSLTGTHQGAWFGVAATGKRITGTGTTTLRMSDGMITDEFVQSDVLGFMQQVGAAPAAAEANKAVVRRYFQEFLNQNNLTLAGELLSADLVVQAPNHPELRGREARRESIASLREAFPDLQFTVHELIAENDKVVARWSIAGTHRGEWLGSTPTGKKVSFGGASTYRIADGMITEELIQWDALGFMQQLGVIPTVSLSAGAGR